MRQSPLVILTHEILNIFQHFPTIWVVKLEEDIKLSTHNGKWVSNWRQQDVHETLSQMMEKITGQKKVKRSLKCMRKVTKWIPCVHPSLVTPNIFGTIIGSKAEFKGTLCRSIYGTGFRWPLWIEKVKERLIWAIKWWWDAADI